MRRAAHRRRGGLGLTLVALLSVLVGVTPQPRDAEATSIVPFAPRFSANDNGSIAVFGNNLMVCPPSASDCAATRAGTTTKNNNSYNMVHLDVDGASFPTFSSSSADVTLPPDAEVRWAGLYWGARLGAGRLGVAAPPPATGAQMKLLAPGDAGYRTITASTLFGPTTTADRAYQAFTDVTSIVQAAGTGAYFGADVPAATGEDRHAGWSLVVVYRSPSLPLRNLTVFDGLADVGQGDPQSITISGFRTPVTGTVNSRIGLVAYEGDRGSTGDRAIFNETQLATSLSPGTNFFNGSNDDNGTLVTARNPSDLNMLGFDIKNFDAPGILANNATSARIDLASTSERFFPGVVTTAIDVFAPDFSPSTKTVTNLTGGSPARVGDRLRYTVTFVNGGQDPAINTSIADPIPAGTSYVPGSLDVPAGVTGSFDAAANAVRVLPGNFPVGRSVTFTFDVDVGAAAADTTVANRATITYDGATVPELQDLTFSTAAASLAVVPSADLVVTKVNTPATAVAGELVTSTITVRNDGPSAATDVAVTDELPPDVSITATTSQGVCIMNVRLLSCSVGTVAPGATVTITVQTTVPPGSTAASLTDVARVTSSTADPDPSDNTAGATTDVTRNADLSVTKTASPTTVTPGGTVTYTLTVTNNGPSTANSVVIDDAVPDPDIEPRLASSTPPGTCTTDPSNARCTIPSLAPGASAVMTVTALALPNATPQVVPNDALVSSATPDSDPSDDTATSSVTIGPAVSDLDVTKTADAPTPLVAGLGTVRYTIGVVNNGPSDADPVTVSDVLPAGFQVVSATTDRGTCAFTAAPSGDTVTCDLGRFIAPFGATGGASGSVTIVATVPATVASGTYPNIATASAPSSPPTTSPSAPVTVEGRANLSIVKAFPLDAPDSEITPGATETYRIRVVNDGPGVADDVVVSDTLPAGLTATAWRPAAGCDVATVTCTLGDVPPGTTVELELDVFVDPDLEIDPVAGVANTATVASATTDENLADNTSTFTASGGEQADISIRKFAPPDAPIAGDTSPATLANRTFTFEIVNFGPSDAENLVLVDVLPPGVTFVRIYDTTVPDVDLSPFIPCTAVGQPQTVTCTFDPALNLPPNVGVTGLGIEFTVDPTVPDGTILTNTVTLASDADDGNPGNNSSTAQTSVRTEVNLVAEKLVVEMDHNGNFVTDPPIPHPEALDPLGVAPGLPVSFAVVVTNQGPSAAANVQVIDAFPLDAAYFPVGDCDFLNGETVCGYSNPATGDLLLPGAGFGVQIITVLDGDTPPGVVTNVGRVSTSTVETTLADNVDTRPINVIDPVADLIIEKAATSSPLVAGETFTYQIAVSAGRIDLASGTLRLSSDATDVVVTDTLPPGLVPAAATSSQGSCTVTGQDVTCALGTIESSIDLVRLVPPALVTITGTVAPGVTGTSIENTAVATSSTPLLGGGDSVSATATTPLIQSADLAVTKATDTPTATAGGGLAFTLTVTNTGPSDATSVVLTDLLPAPLVFAAAGSDPSCELTAGGVVCDLGTVTGGSTRTLTIAATLPSDAPATAVTNTASVTSDVDDPDGTDDAASVDIAVVQTADLAVTKTAAAEGVLLGGTIAYTLAVVNEGPSDALDVVLTESIPAGTTIDTLPPECTGTGPITCDLGDLVAGSGVTLQLVLGVPDTLPPGPLDNTASITSGTDDLDPADNTATETVEAVAQADVTLTKTLVTENPVAGAPIVYELTLVNNGPTVAPNASLSDPIPTGTTFVSFVADQGTCQLDEVEDVPAASCNLGRLEVGATATATLTVATEPGATSVANTGFGGSGGLDEVPADNEDTVTTPLAAVADLAVTKTAAAPTVLLGSDVTYTIAVTNNGPSNAAGVLLTDTIPVGTTAVTPLPAGCTGATTITCAVGALAAGATASIGLVLTVPDTYPEGAFANTATATSDTTDPVLTDNSATATVEAVAEADLTLTKTLVTENPVAGQPLIYELTVLNNGPTVAPNATITDPIPAGTTFTSITTTHPDGTCELDDTTTPATATCALGTLAVEATATATLTLATAPDATTITNTATGTSDGTDDTPADNEATVTSQLSAVADLSVTKTPAAPTVLLGSNVTYTIAVTNNGPSNAAAVVVTDTIPAGTTAVTPLPAGCTGTTAITCVVGALAASTAASFDLVLTVPDTFPEGPFANTATATSDTTDLDPADNSATATVEAVAQADLTLTKTLVTENPVAGEPLVYELTLLNNGPTVAPNATITDPIPAGTTFASITTTHPDGICELDDTTTPATATCALGTLAVGASATATLTLASAPDATSITNTASGASDGTDDTPEDNEATVTSPLAAVADLAVAKSGPAAVSSAATASYVIEYRNDGPSAATDVVITDTLPAGLTPQATAGCTVAAGVVSCAIGTVAAGASGSVTIVADVSPTLAIGASLTDTATIASAATDPDPSDDSAAFTSTVQAENDVGVTVTADQDEVRAGDRASYTVVVINNGPQVASGVTLVNTLPPQIVVPAALGAGSSRRLPAQVPAACLPTGATATCLLGDLAVGATRTIVFGGTVAAGTAAGTNLVDTATVSFDGADSVAANNLDSDAIVVVALLAPPPAVTTTTVRLRCADLTFAEAQRLLAAGATYLDGDRDGIACEVDSGGGSLPSTGTTIGVLLLAAGAVVLVGSGLRTAAADRRRRPPPR